MVAKRTFCDSMANFLRLACVLSAVVLPLFPVGQALAFGESSVNAVVLPEFASRTASIQTASIQVFSCSSACQVGALSVDDYQPPDTGAPTSTVGTGTR